MVQAFAELRYGVVVHTRENCVKYGHNFIQTPYTCYTHRVKAFQSYTAEERYTTLYSIQLYIAIHYTPSTTPLWSSIDRNVLFSHFIVSPLLKWVLLVLHCHFYCITIPIAAPFLHLPLPMSALSPHFRERGRSYEASVDWSPLLAQLRVLGALLCVHIGTFWPA